MCNNQYYVHGKTFQVPTHLNFGKFMLDRLRTKKNEIAIENIDTKKKLSYKELTQYAVNLSTCLMNLGVSKEDTVGVGCEKRNELFSILLSVVFTGGICSSIDIYNRKAVQLKLKKASPKYFICTHKFWKLNKDIVQGCESIKLILTVDDTFDSILSTKDLIVEDVDVESFEPATVRQTDVVFLFFSSGTTGIPKAAPWTHLYCIYNLFTEEFSDESIQTGYISGEWNHTYDFCLTSTFLALGKKVVYPEEDSPESILKSIDKYQAHLVYTTPPLLNFLLKERKLHEYNLDSLRVINSGSAPLHKKMVEKLKERFPNIKYTLQKYGMTEVGKICSDYWSIKGPRPGSVGSPFPGMTIKVLDLNTRQALGPNEQGEVCLKSPILIRGYVGKEISDMMDDEGFVRTGDLGYYDEDRYIYISGRLKEIIISNGYYVRPCDLETILQIHPAVWEAGVVGKSCSELGEIPTAFVVRQPGSSVTEDELLVYVNKQVPPYMQLRGGVKFVEALPKNVKTLRGKIVRQRLKEILEEMQV